MEDKDKVKYLIENNHHMVVATADISSKPWNSPVFYMYDEFFNLYWVSSKDALHSKNIRANKHVAIVIFGQASPDGDMDGAYFDADASELEDEKSIKEAIRLIQKRVQPDKFMIRSLSDVTGDAAWRIYKAVSKQVFKRADATDPKSGQAITIRKEVDLKV